jgi:hypothetical protein
MHLPPVISTDADDPAKETEEEWRDREDICPPCSVREFS